MSNDQFNIPDDPAQVVNERQLHLEFCTTVAQSLPESSLAFMTVPLAQRQMRIAMLTGWLIGRGIDVEMPTLAPTEEQREAAEAAAAELRRADDKVKRAAARKATGARKRPRKTTS